MLFQFHKGTIKTKDRFSLLAAFIDFNSIKVQLKHFEIFLNVCFRSFQFHKGTIKTLAKSVYNDDLTNFNSIKVQLKREGVQQALLKIIEFQFHKGTIKTC